MATVSSMQQGSDIGDRVREAINRALPDRSDASIAAEIGMTPDAFSRSMRGGRAFSTLEIARLGDLLSEDVHWLITGAPDPYRVVFAARHDWDPETMARHVPGRDDDSKTLEAIHLAYTQAQVWLDATQAVEPGEGSPTGPVEPPALPPDPREVRALLGNDFVTTFADRVEDVFGVEVVRIPGLSTDYSFTLGKRRVIVLTAQSNWFRANSSLAHELAHLALGHHDVTTPESADEDAANQFGNELLLPEADMRAIDWQTITEEQLAHKIWEWGVSTKAIRYRLVGLRLPVAPAIWASLDEPTQRVLRRHPNATSTPVTVPPGANLLAVTFAAADPISTRLSRAAERRIPAALIKHHLDGIAEGKINKATLGWLLNTPVEELEVDEPAPPAENSADELIAAFGLAEVN
mgnify:CR=1 FL=1